MTHNISIGILAHNEANRIAQTLASLRQQSIFHSNGIDRIEVVVVPNGCTDNTAIVSSEIFAQDTWQNLEQLTCRICSIDTPGKSNAWNRYIHEFAHSRTNYFVLMDADIEFGQPETLERMVQQLIEHPKAWVSIDQPLKDVQARSQQGAIEAMSAQVSAQQDVSQHKGITGQLYCARADKLRQIWMPQGLSVEDGFLRAMILTDRFTGPENFDRIIFTPNASHIYEAYTQLGALLHHEKRIIIGTIVNQFVFDYFWATCSPALDAGTLVRRQNASDPKWLLKLIHEARRTSGWWLLHPSHTFRRFAGLKAIQGRRRKIQYLPIAAAASIADWAVFWRANRAVHRGQGLGYW